MTDVADVNSADSWPDDADDVAKSYLADWSVHEGSAVNAGETPCEVRVEKVSINVVVPTTETVTEIVVTKGDDFARDDIFARV